MPNNSPERMLFDRLTSGQLYDEHHVCCLPRLTSGQRNDEHHVCCLLDEHRVNFMTNTTFVVFFD